MAKHRELEVISPVELVKPADFIGGVLGVWEKLVETVAESQEPTIENIRLWSSGETTRAKLKPLTVVDPDKLKYYHYVRFADKIRTDIDPFEFRDLAEGIDSDFKRDSNVDIDLRQEIHSSIKQDIGRCTLEGLCFKFDYIDTVESIKYPKQTVFVLKRSPVLIEEEGVKTIADNNASEVRIIDPLQQASVTTRSIVELQSPHINSLDENPGIEDGIPFARTKETDKMLITEFLETIGDQMFDRYVVMRVTDDIDIHWSL